jgi:hypothetical protein
VAESRHLIEVAQIGALVESQVLMLRGQRVMLGQQLAALYGVETRVLTQAVQRNIARFPSDFLFRLERDDLAALRSQAVTLDAQVAVSIGVSTASGTNTARGAHVKYAPYAFTEQGIAMLSSVLRSERAIAVNIEIMRTFVQLRRMLLEHEVLKKQLDQLERKYDRQFKVVFDAIHELMDKPSPSAYDDTKIGFTSNPKKK